LERDKLIEYNNIILFGEIKIILLYSMSLSLSKWQFPLNGEDPNSSLLYLNVEFGALDNVPHDGIFIHMI